MKTPEEIMTGMRKCHREENCDGCPYLPGKATCERKLEEDALQYMEQLEKRCKGLEDRISLMLIQMHGDCACCKHVTVGIGTEPCASCLHKRDHDAWEYRGLPGDE